MAAVNPVAVSDGDPGMRGRAAAVLEGCPSLQLIRNLIPESTGMELFRQLRDSQQWPENSYEMCGRRFHLPRLQTWHADAGIVYSYSDNLLLTRPWTPLLWSLKKRVEQHSGHAFNAVLMNYYRDGEDSVGWHSDDERELGPEPFIASLSLGASREFCYRHKDQLSAPGSLWLPSGSLLLMAPEFQHHWEHCVPAGDAQEGRINLTFRHVYMAEHGAELQNVSG